MNNRRRLKKQERLSILQKTNGHCAYCGTELSIGDMQADHFIPLHVGGDDNLENLLPACRSCNHYKSTMGIESLRKALEDMPRVLMRDCVTYKIAVRYGLVVPNPHNVKFYYEQIK